MGLKFLKRELYYSKPPKRQAGAMTVNIENGETFRQKDGETYHILNLVLYDKAYIKICL